jgi:ribonuclease HI
MEIHTDGYTILGNPSKFGGGYTVIYLDKEGRQVVKGKEYKQPGFTNNEAELRGIHAALYVAGENDMIITDSRLCIKWLNRGYAKARPDLNRIIGRANYLKISKNIKLLWRPREENYAGQYNEMFHSHAKTN